MFKCCDIQSDIWRLNIANNHTSAKKTTVDTITEPYTRENPATTVPRSPFVFFFFQGSHPGISVRGEISLQLNVAISAIRYSRLTVADRYARYIAG
jgi:hypothetical protein